MEEHITPPLGLKTDTVRLLPHNVRWEENAAQTIGLIRSVLGSVCIDAQHIGSTSVKWVSAKPIIDIAAAVNELDDVMPYVDILKENGIIYRRPEYGQLLFLMGDLENDIKTHHIHVVRAGSPEWNNYLDLRDYLNAFPGKAREYDEVKQRLGALYPNDRNAYTSGKSDIISRLLSESRSWRASQVSPNS